MARRLGACVPLSLCGMVAFYGCGGTDDGTDPMTGDPTGTHTGISGSGSCGAHPNVQEQGSVCVLTGELTQDLTLDAAQVWLLRGAVFVGHDDCVDADAPDQNVTLTIEAGTQVFGDTAQDSFLAVTRGAKLDAQGTADAPIVFTSAKEDGERAPGDWGGLVINGRAPLNVRDADGNPDLPVIGEGGAGCYGGTDTADDSGVLRYVRVEFGGKTFTSTDELNGIAFQAVGSGTEVDFIQVHLNQDDGMEFFGGNVQVSHAVITGAGDDSLDWTFGWAGGADYVVIQQHAGLGDRGIEADNNEDANAAEPFSNPSLKHFTLIGSNDGNKAMTLRRGTKASLSDFLVTGYATCVDIDSRQTVVNVQEGGLTAVNSLFECESAFFTQVEVCHDPADDPKPSDGEACPESGADDSFHGATSAMLEAGGNTQGAVELVDGHHQTAPDFNGVAGSAAEGRGALAGSDWTLGWTAYPAR